MLKQQARSQADDTEGILLSLAITGSGGRGAITAGEVLLAAAGKTGFFGIMTRSVGPQVRGGESAALLRIGTHPVECQGDRLDLLAALDWGNFDRFGDELPLDADSIVFFDLNAGPVPSAVLDSRAELRPCNYASALAGLAEDRANMAAVGILGAAAGLPLEALMAGAERVLRDKPPRLVDAARECVRIGYGLAPGERRPKPAALPNPAPARWHISGNEAAALGALRAGVRFVAGYPITPATDMLEWLAPRLPQLGGVLMQAEDELAAINMIIGSSFGGVPSLTATSGPGLSLMMEGIGLAVATETPIVVADVMRGGPSTGIPTKSEQADLDLALYGLHGDAPHVVLAPLGVRDSVLTFDWAVRLAEQLQTAAIVLSDQAIGQCRAVTEPVQAFPGAAERKQATAADPAQPGAYRRYAPSADGVSPMALPGMAGCLYTAEGLEHDPSGLPSSRASDHRTQLDKRARKLRLFDEGDRWAEIEGDGDLCLVTWGSSRGATAEAARRLGAGGRRTRTIALRLLAPLRRERLLQAIGKRKVWVVELNHSGQLFRYLNAARVLPADAQSLARPGPLPLRPAEIVAAAKSEGANGD